MGQSIILSPNFSCFASRLGITVLSPKAVWRVGMGEASPMGLSKKEREEEERQLNCSLPRNLQRCLCHHDLWPLGQQYPLKLCRMERANTVPTFSGPVIGPNSATRLAFHEAFLHSWTITHTRSRLDETLSFSSSPFLSWTSIFILVNVWEIPLLGQFPFVPLPRP